MATSFDNVLGSGGSVHAQWLGYQDAATQSQRLLASVITQADVSRLILTPRYWALLNYRPGTGSDPVLAGLLSLELTERQAALRSAREDFDRERNGFFLRDGVARRSRVALVVADTNVYLHRAEARPEIPWTEFIGTDTADVLLLIPLVVVDELDRAKRHNEPVRSRARTSLKWLQSLFPSGTDVAAVTQPGTDAPRVYARLLLDDLDHRRLPDPDAEIIDAATTVHAVTSREVHLVTADTGMAFRARLSPLRLHLVDADD